MSDRELKLKSKKELLVILSKYSPDNHSRLTKPQLIALIDSKSSKSQVPLWQKIAVVGTCISAFIAVLNFCTNSFNTEETNSTLTEVLEAQGRAQQSIGLHDLMESIRDEGAGGLELSESLTIRVVNYINSLKPYRVLEGGTLSGKDLSPEKGQILMALYSLDIDPIILQQNILYQCDFSNTDLSNGTLKNIDLEGVSMPNSNFENIKLINVNFSRCNLRNVNFCNAKAVNTKFRSSELEGASFNGMLFENSDVSGASINIKSILHFNNSIFDAATLESTKEAYVYLNKSSNKSSNVSLNAEIYKNFELKEQESSIIFDEVDSRWMTMFRCSIEKFGNLKDIDLPANTRNLGFGIPVQYKLIKKSK